MRASPPLPRGQEPHETAADSVPRGTYLSANRVLIEVKAGAPGWLYYADAFHPAWQATVNGKAAKVYQANVGFKAVAIGAGDNEVVFEFVDENRTRLRTALYLAGLAVAALLLAAMAWHIGWPPAGQNEQGSPAQIGASVATPQDLKPIKMWAGLMVAACLIEALITGLT